MVQDDADWSTLGVKDVMLLVLAFFSFSITLLHLQNSKN